MLSQERLDLIHHGAWNFGPPPPYHTFHPYATIMNEIRWQIIRAARCEGPGKIDYSKLPKDEHGNIIPRPGVYFGMIDSTKHNIFEWRDKTETVINIIREYQDQDTWHSKPGVLEAVAEYVMQFHQNPT